MQALASEQSLILLASAAIGALAALSAQLIANAHAARSQRRDIQQRRHEAFLRLVASIGERRIEAYEKIHVAIQRAIEASVLPVEVYDSLRPMFMYLPPSIRETLVCELKNLIGARRSGSEGDQAQSIERLRNLQRELEDSCGIPQVHTGIHVALENQND